MATVLITGTSKGIGLATALAFGRAGYTVAAAMRNPAAAPALAAIAAAENLPITVYTMDVDVDASVQEGIALISKEMGPIDVLVNNAGIERMGSVEELPLAAFRAVMETNYFGPLSMCRAFSPILAASGGGAIVNMLSILARVNLPMYGSLCASKAAALSLTQGVRGELARHGTLVVAVMPGAVDTEMERNFPPPKLPPACGDQVVTMFQPMRPRLMWSSEQNCRARL